MPTSQKTRRFSQVNVRLTQDEAAILQAVALVDQLSSAEVVKPIVAKYLRRRAAEPAIAEILAVLDRQIADTSS
jgi:hypothetical protein